MLNMNLNKTNDNNLIQKDWEKEIKNGGHN